MPGLGSAVSTFSIELDDGSSMPLPGTIYSEVGLTGELQTKFVLEAGSHEFDNANSVWGDTAIDVITNPNARDVAFDGQVASLALSSEGDFVEISDVAFDGDLRMSRFGVSVGETTTSFQELTFQNRAGNVTTVGPMKVTTDVDVEGDLVNARSVLNLDSTPFADFGTANITLDLSLLKADGVALSNLLDAIDQLEDSGNTDDFMFVVEDDVQRLWAHGFEMRIDQLDIALPQGVAALKLNVDIGATDANNFAWGSALLAMNASADISVPVELVDYLTAMDPSYHAAVAGGFLRKNGDVYEMEAAFEKGLLTVNGAPVPLPIPGMQ